MSLSELNRRQSYGVSVFISGVGGEGEKHYEPNVEYELLIEQCAIHHCEKIGIVIAWASRLVIRHCHLFENGESGIKVLLGRNHVIEGCKVEKNGRHGITVQNALNWRVSNNVCAYNKGWGITAGGTIRHMNSRPFSPVNNSYQILQRPDLRRLLNQQVITLSLSISCMGIRANKFMNI